MRRTTLRRGAGFFLAIVGELFRAMGKFASLLLAGGAFWAQDLPPAAGAGLVPAAPVVLENVGKPMVTPFRCTEEDIRSAGLTCSEQDPCPVYLELAAVESTGIRIFAAGNIHTANATLYTILLGSEDNGQTWREVYERVPGAALDHIQFADVATGWTSGLAFGPLPEDPFLLLTTDGGKTWRAHPIFNEPRFGSIQQFFFEDKKSGSLVIDHQRAAFLILEEELLDGAETWFVENRMGTPGLAAVGGQEEERVLGKRAESEAAGPAGCDIGELDVVQARPTHQ